MLNATVINTFSLSEAEAVTTPLVFFVVGIFIYAMFIFKFYRFLARRDIFHMNLQKYSESFIGALQKFFRVIFYILEHLIIFPLFVFFWFGVIVVILSFLSKTQDIGNILLISMALVASIRITAYYNEELSRDLAKMFPFALLAVFLIDITFFSFEDSLATMKLIPLMWRQMIYYLGFTILLELVLRILYGLFVGPFKDKKDKPE